MHRAPSRSQDNLAFERSVDLVHALARAAAWLVRPIIRIGFGAEAPGFPALLALVVLILFSLEDRAVTAYLGLWFSAQICQRVLTYVRWRSGDAIDRYYSGFPWLGSCLVFGASEAAARRIEFLPCAGAALLVLPFSEPLSLLLFAAAIGSMLAAGMQAEADARRLLHIRQGQARAIKIAKQMGYGRDLF